MSDIDRRFLLGAGLAGAAVMAKFAHAGPLNPPPGQVRSSGKTLDTVEPRTPVTAENCPGDQTCTFLISTPGAYCVVSNLADSTGKIVIRIACSGVTLDCRGFTFSGTPGTPSGSPAAISVDDGCTAVDIFDCSCKYFIHAIHAGRACVSVNDIDCDDCTNGIDVGAGSDVSDCRCSNCPGSAYACPDDAVSGPSRGVCFNDCLARSCGTGFTCGSGVCCDCCCAVSCSSGYSCGSDCCLDSCCALECDAGIACGDRASVTACCVTRASNQSSTGVTAAGISVGDDSDCDDCLVVRSSGHGVSAGSRASIDRCCCNGNGGAGAVCVDGSSVCDSSFIDNAAGGAVCGSKCCVFDCVFETIVSLPGGAGPHVRCVSHCRVEDNSFDNASIGVQVQGTGCLVMSNSFHACQIPIEAPAGNSIAVVANVAGQAAFGAGVSPLSNLVH